MNFRRWLNVVTFVLIAVILILAREQLVEAWRLLQQVSWWILILLVPMQFFVYYSGGEMIFTYLRGRGKLQKTSSMEATSMALELNFVNHVFPSGGVAGFSYMAWRLGKLGVGAGQATMAQIVRYVLQLSSFVVLLVLALLFVSVDSKVSGGIVMMASIAVTAIIFLIIFGGYLVGKESRMVSFADWLYRVINAFVKKISFGRVTKDVLPKDRVEKFFIEFHRDFIELKAQKSILLKPALWSIAFNLADMLLFMITFWALGTFVNPAVLLIAYGTASLAGFFVLTPGGAGAYEALMVGVLTAGGVAASTAFAGVILTRTILLLGTIATGFIVYQRALHKYGKPPIKHGEKVAASADDILDFANDSDKEAKKKAKPFGRRHANAAAETVMNNEGENTHSRSGDKKRALQSEASAVGPAADTATDEAGDRGIQGKDEAAHKGRSRTGHETHSMLADARGFLANKLKQLQIADEPEIDKGDNGQSTEDKDKKRAEKPTDRSHARKSERAEPRRDMPKPTGKNQRNINTKPRVSRQIRSDFERLGMADFLAEHADDDSLASAGRVAEKFKARRLRERAKKNTAKDTSHMKVHDGTAREKREQDDASKRKVAHTSISASKKPADDASYAPTKIDVDPSVKPNKNDDQTGRVIKLDMVDNSRKVVDSHTTAERP